MAKRVKLHAISADVTLHGTRGLTRTESPHLIPKHDSVADRTDALHGGLEHLVSQDIEFPATRHVHLREQALDQKVPVADKQDTLLSSRQHAQRRSQARGTGA